MLLLAVTAGNGVVTLRQSQDLERLGVRSLTLIDIDLPSLLPLRLRLLLLGRVGVPGLVTLLPVNVLQS